MKRDKARVILQIGEDTQRLLVRTIHGDLVDASSAFVLPCEVEIERNRVVLHLVTPMGRIEPLDVEPETGGSPLAPDKTEPAT